LPSRCHSGGILPKLNIAFTGPRRPNLSGTRLLAGGAFQPANRLPEECRPPSLFFVFGIQNGRFRWPSWLRGKPHLLTRPVSHGRRFRYWSPSCYFTPARAPPPNTSPPTSIGLHRADRAEQLRWHGPAPGITFSAGLTAQFPWGHATDLRALPSSFRRAAFLTRSCMPIGPHKAFHTASHTGNCRPAPSNRIFLFLPPPPPPRLSLILWRTPWTDPVGGKSMSLHLVRAAVRTLPTPPVRSP